MGKAKPPAAPAYMTIRVEPELRDEFVRLAKEGDRTVVAEVRRALRNHIEQHQPAKGTK